MLHFIKN